jgi:hypothetical protein
MISGDDDQPKVMKASNGRRKAPSAAKPHRRRAA